ncbi:MAG: hypothetical protein E3J67_03620 [Dehalococcoidia bacterium]|nr:MAG: hypothetical protein E3J67_03620 [Dehalococcoidia bacterium]
MITTITTTTTTVVMLQQAAMFTAVGVLVLTASLITKELAIPANGRTRIGSLATRLKLAILPLLFAFAMVVVMKIWEVI